MGSLMLGNVWVFVQLLHRPTRTKHQLYKNPNIAQLETFHQLCSRRITPSPVPSHVGRERCAVLGLLALRGHDVVAPAAAVGAVPPQRGVARRRPGVVLRGSVRVIFLWQILTLADFTTGPPG